MVCTGILVPCFTVAFSLFCVINFGFERSLPTPFSSAAVIIMSRAKFVDVKLYEIPLVGAAAGRFDISGICPDLAFELPVPTITGGGGSPGVGGVVVGS